jgi:hypothetical protein
MPWKEVSRAVHSMSMLSIDIEVEKITEPGTGVFPALLDSTVTVPLVIFKKGIAKEIN